MHGGIRGRIYSKDDIKNAESLGFKIMQCDETQSEGTDTVAGLVRQRGGENTLDI